MSIKDWFRFKVCLTLWLQEHGGKFQSYSCKQKFTDSSFYSILNFVLIFHIWFRIYLDAGASNLEVDFSLIAAAYGNLNSFYLHANYQIFVFIILISFFSYLCLNLFDIYDCRRLEVDFRLQAANRNLLFFPFNLKFNFVNLSFKI